MAGAVASARREHAAEPTAQPLVGDEQVHEARPSDLEALEAAAETPCELRAQLLGHLARRALQARREQQRGIGRVVAEVGPRRALERDPPA